AVSRELSAYKLVVWQICVEGIDNPVAPQIYTGFGRHAFVNIRVPEHVEPVPGVANAVLRTGQEPVDQSLVGLWRLVLKKRVLFGHCRRYANQVEIEPPHQCPLVRWNSRLQSFRALLGRDECVDWVGRWRKPGRQSGAHDRLQDP